MAKARARSARPSDGPHVERAYRNLKAGIVEGRYRPGAPLSEVSLAAEHGMSRTPIREGLARLWQEGYLDRVVGHGYFVSRVTVQQIHDTFDVRRLLEGAAAARAAEFATEEDITRLRGLASVPLVSSQDYRLAESANVHFHLAVARGARKSHAEEQKERHGAGPEAGQKRPSLGLEDFHDITEVLLGAARLLALLAHVPRSIPNPQPRA